LQRTGAAATVTIWAICRRRNSEPKENAYAVVLWDSRPAAQQRRAARRDRTALLVGSTLEMADAARCWLPTLTALLIGVYKLRQVRRKNAKPPKAARRPSGEKLSRNARNVRKQNCASSISRLEPDAAAGQSIFAEILHSIRECDCHQRRAPGVVQNSTATPSGPTPRIALALFDLCSCNGSAANEARIGGYYSRAARDPSLRTFRNIACISR